jgi:hypothetical protein
MSRTFIRLMASLAVLVGCCGAQTLVNPATQINWPLITGAGTPTALGYGCTSVNYGQPFQNTSVTPNTYYTCGSDGWQIRGGSSGGGITIGSTFVPGGGTITNAPGFNSATATALAVNPATCPSGSYQYGSMANGNALCNALPTQPGTQYVGPQAISGCGVQYVSGLTYTVGACTYIINNTTYNSPLTNITLPASDPSNPEIDVLYLDATQTVQYIQGTPAATPQQPTINPGTQLALTFVLVPAGSSTPGGTTTTNIYLNNTGWTYSVGTNVNGASTNNPYSGTYTVEFGYGGAATTTSDIILTDPSSGTVNLSNYNNLIFYVRNKAAWSSSCSVVLQWYNSGFGTVGPGIVLNNGAFGFNALSNFTTYQQVSIPTTAFSTGNTAVATLGYFVTGSGCSMTGFYLDAVSLQGGVGNNPPASTVVNFKGTWSATASYNPNDLVVSGGIGYVALVGNTDVAVTTTATWASLGATGGGGNTTSTGGTNNVVPKFNGANSIINSLYADDGTNGSYSGTGGFTSSAFKTNGTVNGFLNLKATGTPATAPGTGTFQFTTPSSIATPYALEVPATPPPDSTHIYLTCTFANPSVCSWGAGGGSVTLTTVGSGGPATYSGGTLNIPVYAGLIQPYPVVVNSGDSDGVYSPTAPQTSPSSASGCNGTVCNINAVNTHVAGDWVTFNNEGGTWGCLAWAPAQVLSTGLTGSSFEVSEAQAMIPTYAGCTGVVSGLGVGSLIQDSNDLYGQLVVHYPTLSAQGTAVPTLYPYSIPGNTATADAANFTARYGAVAPSSPHGALFINNDGANDFNNCETVSAIETALQSVWTQAHAANYDVLDSTPIGGFTAFNAGIECSQNTTMNYDAVMQWLYAQKCVDGNSTACWDYLADSGGTIKDFSNTNMISSGHPTPAANTIYAAVIDRALSSKMVTYNYNPGAGANVLHGTQIVQVPPNNVTTMETWAFTGGNPSLSICQYGTAMWMSYVNTGIVTSYCPNWLTLNYNGSQGFVNVDSGLTLGFGDAQNCLVCFSLDPSANGPYGLNDTVDLGANVYPSSTGQLHDTTAWLSNGGLKFHNWTADPSVLTNGQVWYNSTSGQLKGYFAGTTICISGTGCSSGAAFPSTNGLVFNTSTTTSRNGTASDLASLAYVADSGTTNAYAAVLAYPISSYTAGLTVTINPGSTNTSTTPTLAVSGLSAVTIVKPVSGSLVALAASDVVSGTLATFKYDGTHFQLQNAQTSAAAGVASVNATSPLTANGVSGSAQTGTVVVACPTCSVGSGTSVGLPGAASLGSVTFNGNVGLLCADTSGSGTAQSCTTTPSITPAIGTCFTYTTTTANSGTGLTLNMDSFGAKNVAVASSSGWTTTLVASTSIPANKPMVMCYDGTNLNASGTGYAPSSGGSYQYSSLPQPVYANFTQVNFQSGTTVGTAGGNIFMTIPFQSSLNWQLLKQTTNPGSAPWSVQAFIASTPNSAASSTTAGLYISDGTKLAGMELLNGSTLRLEHMNSVTSDSGTVTSVSLPALYSQGQYYRICDSGTTIYYETSMDGANWFTLPSFSETVGSFITPTQVLVGGVSVTAGGLVTYVNVKGWSITNSAVCP